MYSIGQVIVEVLETFSHSGVRKHDIITVYDYAM